LYYLHYLIESDGLKMTREKFSPEFMGGVQLQTALMDLTLLSKRSMEMKQSMSPRLLWNKWEL
jgi:hypothetical protein